MTTADTRRAAPVAVPRGFPRTFARVLVLAAATLCFCPATSSAQTPSPTPGSPVVPANQATPTVPPGRGDAGAAIYRKVGCFQCHVNEAQGGANGPKLGPDPVPFARFSQYVRKPTGDMPPYSEKVLSAQDLADIYAFVRTRPRPPAVNTIPLLAP
jgi:mono/diheme cytochrome c family protein